MPSNSKICVGVLGVVRERWLAIDDTFSNNQTLNVASDCSGLFVVARIALYVAFRAFFGVLSLDHGFVTYG